MSEPVHLGSSEEEASGALTAAAILVWSRYGWMASSQTVVDRNRNTGDPFCVINNASDSAYPRDVCLIVTRN